MKLLILNIIIFFLTIIVGIIIVFPLVARGEDDLMLCNGCKKSIVLEYEDGLFKNINFIYEW